MLLAWVAGFCASNDTDKSSIAYLLAFQRGRYRATVQHCCATTNIFDTADIITDDPSLQKYTINSLQNWHDNSSEVLFGVFFFSCSPQYQNSINVFGVMTTMLYDNAGSHADKIALRLGGSSVWPCVAGVCLRCVTEPVGRWLMKVRHSGTLTGHRDPWGALTGS